MRWTGTRRSGTGEGRPSPDRMLNILGWVLVVLAVIAILVGLFVFGALKIFV